MAAGRTGAPLRVAVANDCHTDPDIAEALHIDLDTVETHLRRAFAILQVRNRAQAVASLLSDPGFRRWS